METDMETSAPIWPWIYEPGATDPVQVKEARDELLADEVDLAEIDFSTDEYSVKTSGCISYIADKIVNESSGEGELQVEFNSRSVKLPASVSAVHSVEKVKADDIRYVAIVGKHFLETEAVLGDDWLVLFSVWIPDNRSILNIYLRLASAKDALLLVNSISKLIYEASGKSTVRLKRFRLVHSGFVLLSSCSVEERDEREKLIIEGTKNSKDETPAKDGAKGTLEGDSVDEKEEGEGVSGGSSAGLAPLKQQKMFYLLDEETLSLYEHPLSPKVVHEFRFYKEPEPNAVDMIYICNSTGELEIQQQQQVYFLSAIDVNDESKEKFKELSSILRVGTMRPKHKDIFSDFGKFVELFEERKPPKPKAPTAERPETKPDLQMPFQAPMATGETSAAHAFRDQPKSDADKWLKSLQNGDHLANADEELQVTWYTIDYELGVCIATSNIPESEMESAGIDPESVDQLRTAVEDVKDNLLNRNLDMAVSRVRGLLKVFGGTLLKSVTHLDENELLKRIYFLSG